MLKSSVVRCGICVLVMLGMVLAVSSCKKSDNGTPADSGQTTAQAATPEAAPAETTPAPEPAPTPKAQDNGGEKATGDMVAIPLVLPKPMFVGTPGSFAGIENLEKPLGQARPPFLAPAGAANISAGKPVTSTDDLPIIGEVEYITDGDKEASDGSYAELAPGLQSVTIDLGGMYDIYAVVMWHYHKQGRVYKDVVVQVANDADFIENVQTVFNNDIDNSAGLGTGTDMHYVETAEGKLVDCLSKGAKGRYVRCYSGGNNSNDMNHYIEVEVFGKAVQ